MTEKFITGQLYWHKYPFDEWENEHYYSYASNNWFSFPTDKHGRQNHMLLFLGELDKTLARYDEDDTEYGIFLFRDEKIAVKIKDLCMVDLTDKNHLYHIRKYGDKNKNG